MSHGSASVPQQRGRLRTLAPEYANGAPVLLQPLVLSARRIVGGYPRHAEKETKKGRGSSTPFRLKLRRQLPDEQFAFSVGEFVEVHFGWGRAAVLWTGGVVGRGGVPDEGGHGRRGAYEKQVA